MGRLRRRKLSPVQRWLPATRSSTPVLPPPARTWRGGQYQPPLIPRNEEAHEVEAGGLRLLEALRDVTGVGEGAVQHPPRVPPASMGARGARDRAAVKCRAVQTERRESGHLRRGGEPRGHSWRRRRLRRV